MSAVKTSRPGPSLAFREEQARPKPPKAWRRFRNFWLLSFVVIVLNFAVLLGIGNVNWFEKGLLLVAVTGYLQTKKPDTTSLVLVAMMVGVTWLCGLITRFPDFSWTRYASAVIALCSLLLYLCAWPTQRERKLILYTLAFVPLAIVFMGVLYELGGLSHITMNDHTGANRLAGSTVPAYLAGAGCAGAIAAAFLSTCFDRRYLLLTAINLAITFLTASRTPSVCALAGVGVILFSGLKSGVWRLTIATYGVALLGGFMAIFGDQLILRLNSNSSSGRDQLWAALEVALEQYPITGVGFGHHGLLVPDEVSKYLGTVAAHNEFLRISVELGYVGGIIFLILFLLLLGRILMDRRNNNRLAFGCLIGLFLLISYTDNTLYATYLYSILLASFMGIANAEPMPRADPNYKPGAMRGPAGPRAMSSLSGRRPTVSSGIAD